MIFLSDLGGERRYMVINEKELEIQMRAELELMKEFSAQTEILRQCIAEKNWLKLEKNIESMNHISMEIDNCENLRNETYSRMKKKFGIGESVSFYMFTTKFKKDEQQILNDLYGQLKLEVIKIKTGMESLKKYIDSVSGTMEDFLSSLFPQRKGKIYGKDGHAEDLLHPPLILDKQL